MTSSTMVSSTSIPEKPFLEKNKEFVLAVSLNRAKVIQDLERVNELINKSKIPKKDYYAIFTSPGKGVYDEWHKVSLFIINRRESFTKSIQQLNKQRMLSMSSIIMISLSGRG